MQKRVLSFILIAILFGCKGGQSDNSTIAPQEIKISIIDGVLKNALVFVDKNQNNKFDFNKDTVLGLSDDNGQIKVNSSLDINNIVLGALMLPKQSSVLKKKLIVTYSKYLSDSIYTEDLDYEGEPVSTVTLFGFKGSLVVSPLTSLVRAEELEIKKTKEYSSKDSLEQAKEKVSNLLHISIEDLSSNYILNNNGKIHALAINIFKAKSLIDNLLDISNKEKIEAIISDANNSTIIGTPATEKLVEKQNAINSIVDATIGKSITVDTLRTAGVTDIPTGPHASDVLNAAQATITNKGTTVATI
ncbi:hypothetical protein, partial [Vibrio ezurae]